MLQKVILYLSILIFVFPGLSYLHAQEEDVEGSEDHPMITRYADSYIRGYEQYAFDRLVLATEMENGDIEETAFEGKVTRIHYVAPEGRSSLEVHRNYMMALRDAGFEIGYEYVGDEETGRLFSFDIDGVNFGELTYFGQAPYYFFARLTGSEGDIVVSVHTVLRRDQPNSVLQIVEEQPMETGMVDVSVDAATMASNLADAGRVMIYGIHFDTGQADIKQESESTLAEIADLLNNNPDLNLGVVGHTDAVGGLDFNMDLSERRAEAVVDYLVSEYEISDERLSPHGVAFLAPEATNETEEGRALNRRVELIQLSD